MEGRDKAQTYVLNCKLSSLRAEEAEVEMGNIINPSQRWQETLLPLQSPRFEGGTPGSLAMGRVRNSRREHGKARTTTPDLHSDQIRIRPGSAA